MNLLITVIGNAAVHPEFRKELLNDPLATIDRVGLPLNQGRGRTAGKNVHQRLE